MYTYAWKKYLPVIRILLKRSSLAEQVLSVNRIDFEKANRNPKNTSSFTLESNNGKLTPIHPVGAGKDLADVLLEDPAIKLLMRSNHYVFTFTRNFELCIKNISIHQGAPDEVSAASAEE